MSISINRMPRLRNVTSVGTVNQGASGEAARAAFDLGPHTTELQGSVDADTVSEFCTRGAVIATNDGELLARSVELLVGEGRVDEARPLVERLAPTWRHTWGEVEFSDVHAAVRAMRLHSGVDAHGLGMWAYEPDSETRLHHALAILKAEDWTLGTRLLHDLGVEEGDLHTVLPMLARGYWRMG